MSTASRTDTLTRELVGAWSAFGPAYFKWLAAGQRETGISYARARVLKTLHHRGPQIMSAIRDELGVTARSVTALVDALEAEGLVRRTPHPSDRRATVIELTEAGLHTIEELRDAFVERAVELFARLPREDQEHLLRTLRRLARELTDLGGMDLRGCAGPFA